MQGWRRICDLDVAGRTSENHFFRRSKIAPTSCGMRDAERSSRALKSGDTTVGLVNSSGRKIGLADIGGLFEGRQWTGWAGIALTPQLKICLQASARKAFRERL